ncbi:MAG TPA: hypothetical protein VN982_04005 [Candidatus Dormibacteraeota bacterium]|nr:hypothetical protein [Candidatus Dormibacteraeota bacterium]
MKKSAGRSAQEVCATTAEVMAAIESLSAEEFRRLKSAAWYRIRGLGRAARHRDHEDLLGEALASTLKGAEGGPEGRKWAKDRVRFVKHLLEAMRSIANHWKESWERSGAECEEPDWLTAKEDEDGNVQRLTEQARDRRADTHRSCSAKELREELDKHFAGDEDALLVIEARIEGMTVPEMITGLNLTEKKINAAHQRIRYFMETKGWTSA